MILQSRVYKKKIFCIFLNRDYVYFTKMYYLCSAFRKRVQYYKKIFI